MAPRALNIYQELTGAFGWTCPYCRSESRYVYGERDKARSLAIRHTKRCRKKARG